MDSGAPSLKHQRTKEAEEIDIEAHHIRGLVRPTEPAQKYRKGACENCGSMTHKATDCLERPRKVGARFNPKDIRPDEFVRTAKLTFDGKRDRWAGYDAEGYAEVVESFEKAEEEKRRIKDAELEEAKKLKMENGQVSSNESTASSSIFTSSDSDSDDEERTEEAAPVLGEKRDPKSRISVRNLRLREDTAKYLRNLDPDSAHYDPKTRSMRDNPNPDKPSDPCLMPFEGDNFVRMSGDATKIPEMQIFAWQAAQRGVDVNLAANPSLVEKMHKEHEAQKSEEAKWREKLLAEAYGTHDSTSGQRASDSESDRDALFDTL